METLSLPKIITSEDVVYIYTYTGTARKYLLIHNRYTLFQLSGSIAHAFLIAPVTERATAQKYRFGLCVGTCLI